MREARCSSFGGEAGPHRSFRARLASAAGLLIAGVTFGCLGTLLLNPDQDPTTSPFETSLQRAVELRTRTGSDSATLTAHHLNIFNKAFAGIAELAEAARMQGPSGDGARRALRSLRSSVAQALGDER